MGRLIADLLQGDLDLVLVHKIGAPGNPEFAVGAVSEDGAFEINPMLSHLGYDPEALKTVLTRESDLLRQKRKLYAVGAAQPSSAEGRSVIIVDDGIATGHTMLLAVKIVKTQKPTSIFVATPVAAQEAVEKLREEVERLVVLLVPPVFVSVGQFYQDFNPVSDQEVVDALSVPRKKEKIWHEVQKDP